MSRMALVESGDNEGVSRDELHLHTQPSPLAAGNTADGPVADLLLRDVKQSACRIDQKGANSLEIRQGTGGRELKG